MKSVSNALQFQAQITAQFVIDSLQAVKPLSRLKVLDVGCGEGLIANLLLDAGLDVLAIDLDDQDLLKAQARGVDARHIDYINDAARLPQDHFDAILFSRSLHHILPLDQALLQAQGLLKIGGKILVEDFGYELVDQATALWLFSLADLLRAQTVCSQGREDSAKDEPRQERHRWLTLDERGVRRTADGALQCFRQHHEVKHSVTSFKDIYAALAEHLQILSCTAEPYLFRYLCDLLPAAGTSLQQALQLRAFEMELSQCGAISLCGRRIVAQIRSRP